ncbi:hypothetical protein P3S68_033105 [Capsicum galapagoense]
MNITIIYDLLLVLNVFLYVARTCLRTCIISFSKILQHYENGGGGRPFIDIYEDTHRKKNKDVQEEIGSNRVPRMHMKNFKKT